MTKKLHEIPAAPANHNTHDALLADYVVRIERLTEERTEINGSIRDIFIETKARGYNSKVIREMLKLRKLPSHEREEWEVLRDAYMRGLDLVS